jgi:hypothetical protein
MCNRQTKIGLSSVWPTPVGVVVIALVVIAPAGPGVAGHDG